MAEEIKQEKPASEKKDESITLTEKIVAVVLIGYVIALIWLTGSSHWLGVW